MFQANSQRLHAVILAGSHDWQQGSLQAVRPNALLPVVNFPLIDHTLGWLSDSGIVDVSICANRNGLRYQRHLGTGEAFGLSLNYYEDRVPRGPAGAARDAALFSDAEDFVIIDGSVLPSFDLQPLIAAHRESGADLTETAANQSGQDQSNGNMGNPVGVRMVSRAGLEMVPATGFQDFKEMLVPELHQAGCTTVVYSVDEQSPRIRNVPSYFAAQRWGLQRVMAGSMVLRDYDCQGQCATHQSADIAPSTRTVGPVVIGANAEVAEDVLIVGPAVIGSNVKIDSGVVIGQSVLWESAHLGEKSVVTQCVVTADADVAEHTTMYRTICV